MAKRKRQPPQPGTDQFLCPVQVSGTFGVKRPVIAAAMRQAGREQPLTVAEARRWRDHPELAPDEGVTVLAAVAAALAEREHRERQAGIEYEHRTLILTERVARRLLTGATHFRSPETERIAQEIAVRASKELCRAHTGRCGEINPEILSELDKAALRWADVDPLRHSTWIIHRGDCRE